MQHEPIEHTFEQPSIDQQPPTPSQEATTSQLMARIADLEKQLKETKQTFRKAILTLVERVKSLEVALKRNTKRVLLSDSEEEETEAQWRKTHNLDPLVSLVHELVTPSKTVNASEEEQVEDISPTTLEAAAILTKVKKIKSVDKGKRYKRRKSSKRIFCCLDVNTGNDPVTTDSIRVSVPSPDRGRREGKAPMTEEETQASKKTKEQILQEEAGLAEAIRFRIQLEKAWKRAEGPNKGHYQKQRLEANAELRRVCLERILTVKDYCKRMVELGTDANFLKNQGTWKLTQLKKLNFEEVKAEFEKLVKQLDTYVPMNFEATKESLKRFGEELQTKTAKKLKFDDESTQPTEEKVEEDKDDKPTKKTRKRRKQIARKGLHTDLDKDDYEYSDEDSEKDNSTSSTKIPINLIVMGEMKHDMVYSKLGAMLTDISRDDLTELYRIVMKNKEYERPED
ncbi:hypothetical protein Tco_0520420 [Tanacetum coccineum]